MRVLMTASKQSQVGTAILTLFGSGHQNLHETYQCRMDSRELLVMGKEDARNMYSCMMEYIWVISASSWLVRGETVPIV